MEADWAVEIGPDLPRIIVPWQAEDVPQREDGVHLAFVDLRREPAAIDRLDEPRRYLVLKRALKALNQPSSPVFTSKCDVFALSADEIDPFEFDVQDRNECAAGLGSYIDLLVCDPSLYSSFSEQESWTRRAVERLRRSVPIGSSRADLVLRRAEIFAHDGYGLTLYVAACGRDAIAARERWEAALDAVATELVAL